MSKAKNLLDFYPVVKKPRQLPIDSFCPPTKRIKIGLGSTTGSPKEQQLVESPSTTSSTTSSSPTTTIINNNSNNKWYGGIRRSSNSIWIQLEPDTKINSPHVDVIKRESAEASGLNIARKRRISNDDNQISNDKPGADLHCKDSTQIAVGKYTSGGCKISDKLSKSNLMNQLMKSGKIVELKETLIKLNAAKAKLKQKATSTTVNLTSSPTKRETSSASELDKQPHQAPAYQRFHSLATSDSTSQLKLPYTYKFLAEAFHSTDTVASIMHNRQEVCTFTKLKPSVQEMLRRNFELKHLAQIKTVYPSAYIFKQERILCRGNNLHPTVESQLTIAINKLDCFSKNEPKQDDSTKKVENVLSSVDPGLLISRRRMFRQNLINILMEHHAKFLSTLDPPLMLPADEIHRWHPSFPIEDVPNVQPSPLPEVESTRKYMTAKDVLNKVKGLYNKKIDKALENVARKSALEEERCHVPSMVDSSKPSESNSRLKGIPLQLLAKIRAKEAEKIKAEITRNPVADKRKIMLSRLPEIVRILKNFFIAEKKAAIPLGIAVKKIGESFIGSLTPIEMEDHLKLLAELAPTWLSCVTIKSGVFLKLDRHADVNLVIENVVQHEKAIL